MNAATCNKITQVAYDTYYKDNKYNVSVNLYKYYKFGYIIRDKNNKDIILCCGSYILSLLYVFKRSR